MFFRLTRCGHDVHELRQEPSDPPPVDQHHELALRHVGRLRVRQVLPQPQNKIENRNFVGGRKTPASSRGRHSAERIRRENPFEGNDGRVEGRADGQSMSADRSRLVESLEGLGIRRSGGSERTKRVLVFYAIRFQLKEKNVN